ncbi:MAG: glycosyltransferase family 4 protein [Bryobacteraceae bacterium]
MKIAWFTPFSEQSAIGRCSALVVEQLKRFAEVDIWHPKSENLRASTVRTVRIDRPEEIVPANLAGYDLLVYNFGNYLPFHKDIFEISQRSPGIAILHDFVYHHFFAQYWLTYRNNPEAYKLTMERRYGQAGRREAESSLARKNPVLWETDRVVDYPLFEDIIGRMYGVVVHSNFFAEKVRACYPGPVTRLPLPYDIPQTPVTLTRADLSVPEGSILLVTIGHLNPNKLVHQIIEVLGRNRDRLKEIFYVAVGPCDPAYQERLQALVTQFDLRAKVRLTGYATDELLTAYVSHADVCINLRHPSFEGASASVIEEMLHGKPVIVTNGAFCSELPDDCVLKIRPGQEAEELPNALHRLIGDGAARSRLGANARNYAREQFHAERYVRELLPFIREVREGIPLLQLTDRIAVELNHMGATAGMDIVQSISRHMDELFSPPRTGLTDRTPI